MSDRLRFVDVCSGAGGLASGLESAGFSPVLLLDDKPQACETLLANRPQWNVVREDLVAFLQDILVARSRSSGSTPSPRLIRRTGSVRSCSHPWGPAVGVMPRPGRFRRRP
ncbi:DNA cytosine methyltransferase [Streptomyces sp. R-07]|uniref:DNA cytosine methyltransferase n=1 Tax=unclassified Streptomyces TaxID=2593676 RepID=UPI00341AF3C5